MTDRVLLPIASGAATWRVVRTMLRARRGLAVGAVVTIVAAAVAGLAFPPIVGRITDAVIAGSGATTIDVLALALLGALLAQAVLSGWATVLVARLGEQALATLREDVVDRALSVPLAQVERAGHRRSGGPGRRRRRRGVARGPGGDPGAGDRRGDHRAHRGRAGAAGLAARARRVRRRAGPRAGRALVPAPGRAAVRRRAGRRRRAGPAAHRDRGRAPGRSGRSGSARSTPGWSRDASARALDATLRTAWTGSRFFFCINGAELVGTAAVLVAGFLGVRAGIFSVGDAAAAALYFHGLFNPIGYVLTLIDTAQDAAASLRRLVGVTEPARRRPSPRSRPSSASPRCSSRTSASPTPAITTCSTASTSTSRRASGSRWSGPSGAGKTTIAKLIAGIHRPGTGSVRLGGATHDELGPTRGRAAITLVTQEVHVFAGPIADDLRLARPDATDARAARRAGRRRRRALGRRAARRPGHRGRRGRAPAHHHPGAAARAGPASRWPAPPIVVLDEATAEAGSAGARELERAADAATAGRTTLVVAHRLTQAAAADRIAVVDDGRIVEDGPHASSPAARAPTPRSGRPGPPAGSPAREAPGAPSTGRR